MTDPRAQLDDYRWLVSAEAEPWLTQFATCVQPSVAQVRELRKAVLPNRAHLVLEQVALRHRAALKFELPGKLFFTRVGLEQATDQWIAQYKASRFGAGRSVADICCGIGGDLLALAQRGPAVGVDKQPLPAFLAETNARVMGHTECTVAVADADTWEIRRDQAWHMDPDRRPAGTRTSQVEFSHPPQEVIERLLASRGDAALKLAPAAELPADWNARSERQWLGSGRECRQQVAWFGALAQFPSRRTAVVVDRYGGVSPLVVDDLQGSAPIAGKLRRFLYEPHATLIAAHLVPTLARQLSLEALEASSVYLTGDAPLDDLRIQSFQILETLPFDLRRLRGVLRERRIGRLEVKKRGVDIDPRKVQQTLEGEGDEQAVLLVTRLAGTARAILARRPSLGSREGH